MDPVVHFELPAQNKERMCSFYESAFGWKTTQLGPEMGDYVIAETTPTDEDRMVTTPGNINGGFFTGAEPGQGPRVTISVDDIRAAFKRVEAAGGKVLGGSQSPSDPDEIPGVGLYATFIDTEGNKVSLLQPAQR